MPAILPPSLLPSSTREKKSVGLSSHAREIAAVYFHIKFGGGEERELFSVSVVSAAAFKGSAAQVNRILPKETKRRDVGDEEEEAGARTASAAEAVLLRRHIPGEDGTDSGKGLCV